MLKKTLISILLLTALVTTASATAELSIFPQESTSEINSFTSFEIAVENTGNVEDVYSLASDERQVTVAPSEVRLDAGETKTVNAWYNPDAEQTADAYPFTVTATSRATGDTTSVSGLVNVVTDHAVDINAEPQSQVVCRDEAAAYNVEVTNEGIQQEEFHLSTARGEFETERVTLEAGETRTVQLTESSAEAVDTAFRITAASTTSYAEDSAELHFAAEACYESETAIEPETQDVAAFTEAEFEVAVENLGTREDEFTLTTNRGQFDDETGTIPAGETGTTILRYTPEELEDEEIQVTAEGVSQSSATAEVNVYNGMDLEVGFDQEHTSICEDESLSRTVNIQNTGEATETYELETTEGELDETEVSLNPGESTDVALGIPEEDLEEGETGEIEVTGTSTTFGEPEDTTSLSYEVENCWDLELNVVPTVMSAGENRSVVYEIHLENTGARENTYTLSHEGPEWIDVQPDEKTLESGETEVAHMFAGIPFNKEGEVRIPVTAEGHGLTRNKTATLLVGEEIEEAIRDERNLLTGSFHQFADRVGETTNTQRAIVSIVIGLLVTAIVLYRS